MSKAGRSHFQSVAMNERQVSESELWPWDDGFVGGSGPPGLSLDRPKVDIQSTMILERLS
jgi:hypothetical protein